MITAVDTSVLLDVLRPNANFVDRSLALIETSATLGPLVLCDLVYAELAANFERMQELDAFLADAPIRREAPNANALFLSGRMWRAYRSAGGSRERIISDFVVGAHARVQASRLVTRDRGFYRRYFGDLVVVEP